jgi:hypothetical protein
MQYYERKKNLPKKKYGMIYVNLPYQITTFR